MPINIIPRAIDISRFPIEVCRAMEVVRTLVYPLIFPPIIMATPTSERALPKASKTAAITANLASLITVDITWVSFAPRDTAVSLIWGLTPFKAEIVSPMTMGEMRMVWPMTMPIGV